MIELSPSSLSSGLNDVVNEVATGIHFVVERPPSAGCGDPIAVWDVHDKNWDPFSSPCQQRCEWAQQHFPDRANAVWRAEFYVIDVPFVVLYRWQHAEGLEGYRVTFIDAHTRKIAQRPPLTLILSELLPAAIL